MRELWTLLKKDARVVQNLRRLLAEQSRFKVLFILLFAGGLVVGMGVLFYEGFRFLASLGGLGLVLVYRLFYLFFFGLGALLVLSGIVTTYATVFRSEETGYLLLQPVSMSALTFYKSLQSAFYTSWAFFFVIVPFVGAFALHERLPWSFPLWILFFSVPFVLLCSAIGFLICLVGLPALPRSRLFRVGGLVVLVLALLLGIRLGAGGESGPDAFLFFNRIIPGLRWASHPLWPSWWVAEGCMALVRGQALRGCLLWGVLVSHVLVAGVLVDGVGRRFLFNNWQRVQFATSVKRRSSVLLPGLDRWLGFVPRDLRALMIKDIRTFLRDPAQWAQALFFFGLLGLYFLNLRTLRYHLLPPVWRNLITFLNIFSVCAVMASLGCRFIYPQLSLEGHGFWVVGLSPTTRGRILAAKFLNALWSMGFISVVLMAISTHMLATPAALMVTALLTALAMALVVSALSTGLGAVFLDLKQRNPAAIVSGFGGTLNLVLNLGFMLTVLPPLGLVFHLHFTAGLDPGSWPRGYGSALLWLIVMTLVFTLLPLRAGSRSLRRRELA